MTEAAFANPAQELALAFRPILDAMANPGRIQRFAPLLSPPPGLSAEAAAVALTLCDFQTPIWLGQGLRTPAVEHYLRFHAGAPLTRVASEAFFVFADANQGVPPLELFPKGTSEYPDRSATVIIQTAGLRSDAGITLRGPGILAERQLAVDGLDEDFWRQMIVSRMDFPLGIDVIFVGPETIAAVPRSTQIHPVETV